MQAKGPTHRHYIYICSNCSKRRKIIASTNRQCMLLRNLKDTKRIIRSRNSKNGRQYTDQTKQDTRLNTHHYLHNATHDTWRFSNKNLTKNRGLAVPTPLVSPVVLLLNDTNIIWYGNRSASLYCGEKFCWHVSFKVDWMQRILDSSPSVFHWWTQRWFLEMPVPSQGHYGFHSFPVVDWFCLCIYLWVLTFPLLDCSEILLLPLFARQEACQTLVWNEVRIIWWRSAASEGGNLTCLASRPVASFTRNLLMLWWEDAKDLWT